MCHLEKKVQRKAAYIDLKMESQILHWECADFYHTKQTNNVDSLFSLPTLFSRYRSSGWEMMHNSADG